MKIDLTGFNVRLMLLLHVFPSQHLFPFPDQWKAHSSFATLSKLRDRRLLGLLVEVASLFPLDAKPATA